MAVRSELVYGQVPQLAGLGEIHIVGTYTAEMEVNEIDSNGKVVGRRTVQKITVVRNDDGVYAIPGDLTTQLLPWHELKDVVPKDLYQKMENALKRGKRRRKKTKTSR